MTKQYNLLKFGVAAIAVLTLTLFVGWWQVDGPGAAQSKSNPTFSLVSMDFKLNNHKGQEVGPDSLIGKALMVFFGFTHCPDICPTTLSDISSWLDALGDKAEKLNVVFITVDPIRDTTKAMAEYVSFFHPAIEGWTGSEQQIASATADFRVSYEKVAIDSDDYTMNHTSNVLLFDLNGNLSGTIDYHETKATAVPKIQRALQ